MRKLTIVALSVLAFAAPSLAAPPAGVDADPELNYLVTRVLANGSEKVLGTGLVEDWGDNEQVIREAVFTLSRQQRTNNPSWRVIIYGPVDPPSTYWTDDDRIWDSATDL